MWRHAGIFRDVALLSFGKVRINDLYADATLSGDYKDGEITITAKVWNAGTVRLTLLDGEETVFTDLCDVINGEAGLTAEIKNVKPWTAETPHRYELIAEIPGQAERDGVFFLNGKAV